MQTIEFKGKTYELKNEISFGDLMELSELRDGIEVAQKIADKAERETKLETLGNKNLKLIAETLHTCLGLTGKDLKQFSLKDALALFNDVVARSASVEKN